MFRIEYPHLDMRKIADSGQIFRFNIYEDEFSLVAGDRLLFIKEDGDGYILWIILTLDLIIKSMRKIFQRAICF